jgi:hypothetical protein
VEREKKALPAEALDWYKKRHSSKAATEVSGRTRKESKDEDVEREDVTDL